MSNGKNDTYAFPNPDPGSAAEKIKRRRLQILVHSCLYYELDTTLIEDDKFDSWCKELVQLMKDNPGAYSDRFDYWFNSFTGETGFHLPLRDVWVYNKAMYLKRIGYGSA